MVCEGGHDWEVVGGVFAADAMVESSCRRCPATTVETQATLNPGRDMPGLEDPLLDRDPELSGGSGPA